MKKVSLLVDASDALARHKNMAPRILDKLEKYAENPKALANQVTTLRGQHLKRLKVGAFRVLFEETETEIIVTDIGPRGSIYQRREQS